MTVVHHHDAVTVAATARVSSSVTFWCTPNAQGLGNAHMQPCLNTVLPANSCGSCHSTYQIGCIAAARAAWLLAGYAIPQRFSAQDTEEALHAH
eukprot:4817-Heterococcus_DN1.PRE.1